MEGLTAIFELLHQYQLPALFIGALLFGEVIIIPAAFLAAQGYMSPMSVFSVSLAGALIADSFWYAMGGRLLDYCGKHEWCKKKHDQALRLIEKLTGTNPFFYLVLSKFLYGTRIVSIIYVSMRSKDFFKFSIYNALGSAIWLTILVSVSYSAGKSFSDIGLTLDRIELAALSVIGIIVAFKLLELWASKMLARKQLR